MRRVQHIFIFCSLWDAFELAVRGLARYSDVSHEQHERGLAHEAVFGV
jgi:hypothetical protein